MKLKNLKLLIFIIILLKPFFSFSSQEKQWDLKELFEEAKLKNTELQASKINQDILSAQKSQVRSALLPTISLNASFTQNEQARNYANRNLDDTAEVVTFKGVQRIFSGLKEFYTLRKIQFSQNAEVLNQQYRELELLSQLSQIYFNIVYQQEKITNTKELLQISLEREQLHKERVKIGKSRQSELRQAMVQTKKYNLSLKESEMILKQEWNNLRLITGNNSLKQVPLKHYNLSTNSLKPLSYYHEQIENHPLIKAADESIFSLEEEKKSIKSDFFPTVNVTSNYYANSAYTTTIAPEWDIGLSISYPFFEGGLTKAKISEASHKIHQKASEKIQLKKSLVMEVEKTYESLLTKIEQNKMIEELCQDNKKNYLEIKKEYSIGLVSNLDVITSLNTYVESLDQKAEYSIDVQLNTILLKLLIGENL